MKPQQRNQSSSKSSFQRNLAKIIIFCALILYFRSFQQFLPVLQNAFSFGHFSPTALPTFLTKLLPPTPTLPTYTKETLEQTILAEINRDRSENGLNPVAWDASAAQAAELHAQDMANFAYFSHWDKTGNGPQWRYLQVGGTDSIMENIHSYTHQYEGGEPAPIQDFVEVVIQAQKDLMNSPGHRQNILAPEHTHVGVGFAYSTKTGSFYLAQEFTNRYVEMQPLPLQIQAGEKISIQGKMLPGATKVMLNLTYRQIPSPMSQAELNATHTYSDGAEIYQAIIPKYGPDNTFEAQIPLDNEEKRGLYGVRVWVKVADKDVLASNWLVEVH